MASGEANGATPFPGEQRLDLAILWCRRDLRVTDNPALNAALQLAEQVVRNVAQRPYKYSSTSNSDDQKSKSP